MRKTIRTLLALIFACLGASASWAATAQNFSSPGSRVMINPQPLPPKTATTTVNPGTQFNKVMLNPQPLPPRVR